MPQTNVASQCGTHFWVHNFNAQDILKFSKILHPSS